MAILNKVKSAPSGRDNIDILGALNSAMNPMVKDIDNAVDRIKLDKLFRPGVKFATSFAFEDGLARFAISDETRIFEPVIITDPALLRFREKKY
jgi:hypothetical protein